jgi:phospho-N-acetylmuramoyl-pentapeptide-transferase
MFYSLLYPLAENFKILNLFKYITFRTGGALATAFVLFFWAAPSFIRRMKHLQGKGQPIREFVHQEAKKGTPTMGGVLIFLCMAVSLLLWADLNNPYILILLFSSLGFVLIGFTDDYIKVVQQDYKGMSGRLKLFCQGVVSLTALWFILKLDGSGKATHLAFPFFKKITLDLGVFYFVFGMLVITGASNAVNLTDGLDGLATFPIIMATVVFLIIAYLSGHAELAKYLHIYAVSGSGEIAVFCGAIIGACLGFLWFNAPPAQIFMGDTGSLFLGGSLGIISVITKNEIVLAIVGGLFVLEALSVMVQMTSLKLFGKKVFLMSPIHHHFEKKGWPETTIVVRFWIISILLAFVGLATLKIR